MPNINREYRILKPTGPAGLTLKEGSFPNPRRGEVLVKIHAVSLQYRDLVLANGHTGSLGVKDNLIPGSDAAGEVIQVGEDVVTWNRGDRVAASFFLDHIAGLPTKAALMTALGGPINGVLVEYKTFPAHSLVRIPEHLSYEEGSTLPCAAVTAYNALMGPTPVKGGDYVLVQGTGGVSIFGLQFAVTSGAVVIATSSSDKKLEVAKKLGAKYVINYITTPNWDEEVLKITNGQGVDHILEVGGPDSMGKSFKSLRYGGNVHTIGGFMTPSSTDIVGQTNLAVECLLKAANLRGVNVGSRHQLEAVSKLISVAQLKPVADKVFPFDNVREAYEYLESQRHVGKVVVRVAHD